MEQIVFLVIKMLNVIKKRLELYVNDNYIKVVLMLKCKNLKLKHANKRHIREQARVERDRAMEQAIIRAQCEKQLTAEARSQEERLATELERIKHEKLRDEKMRQQIRYFEKENKILFVSHFYVSF